MNKALPQSVKSIGLFLILPFYLLFQLIKNIRNLFADQTRSLIRKLFSVIISAVLLIIFTPIWFFTYFLVGFTAATQLRLVARPIPISGTGSMYPTFPKGEGVDPKELSKQIVSETGMLPYPNGLVIRSNRLFGYDLARGDIVVVENSATRSTTQELLGFETGWVKRLIGLPGDSIELRDGLVYLNGSPLAEPYIAKPRSTFGESFLSECRVVQVPPDSVFVMGDNRTGSSDSREVGFFHTSDIQYMLPLAKQVGSLESHWRDTSSDFSASSEIHLDKQQYLRLLNAKRQEAGVSPLKYQPKLEQSARKRGEVILKYDDFSFTATRSGYPMEKSLVDADYWNPLYGEIPVLGHLEAQELLDNQFEFPSSKKFVLDKDFQEVGIAEVKANLNGCPTQVIVLHFAGYVPPNYSSVTVESWKSLLTNLRDIRPGWQKLTDSGQFYTRHKSDIDRINAIIFGRITTVSRIVDKMTKNLWLTDEEKRLAEQDEKLAAEQNTLSARLNSANNQ